MCVIDVAVAAYVVYMYVYIYILYTHGTVYIYGIYRHKYTPLHCDVKSKLLSPTHGWCIRILHYP